MEGVHLRKMLFERSLKEMFFFKSCSLIFLLDEKVKVEIGTRQRMQLKIQ